MRIKEKNRGASQKITIVILLVATIFTGYKAFESNYYFADSGKDSVSQDNKVYNAESYYSDYAEINRRLTNIYGASTVYNNTEVPSIEYQKSLLLYVGETYDPMNYVSANHPKFGDLSDLIQVTYNDVNTNIPGEYTTVYKACNYYGSTYCRTATMKVTVKYKNNTTTYNNSYSTSTTYNKKPVWSNYSQLTCNYGDNACYTYNITAPTAKDPYNDNKLNVVLISGDVDPYQAGTYSLVYQATTNYGVTSTVTKKVVVNTYNNSSYAYNNSYTYENRKYISGYDKEYYDDGYYSGYLTLDNNSSSYNNQKYISNYEWTNVVTYLYQCTAPGYSGTDGWSYLQTVTSDNHPTYAYNQDGYRGTLDKVGFYCKDGCDEKLISKLGTCTSSQQGQYKYITRTWVGIYSGFVSNNINSNSYSGYVYLK